MYLKRTIDKELVAWKTGIPRKPLLLRGARQVGKTQTVRQLGASFKNYLEVNFETDLRAHSLFAGDLNPREICENLSLLFNISIVEGETLLFFDEIQSCLPAIQSLRFFYEKMPGLHVIAAGSLLEFALSEIPTFGVGRIRSIFMYPMSFNEFLLALGENKLLNKKKGASPQNPLPAVLHEKLLGYLKRFIILGGMPEVISTYVSRKDINSCMMVLNDLVNSFNDDFTKYKSKIPALRLRDVFESAVKQAGRKFIFSKAGEGNHQQLKEALNLLIMAGIAIPVVHSSANGLPLAAEANHKKQKIILFDTGIFQRVLNLDLSEITLSNDFQAINKGSIAEAFTGLELLKYHSPYERGKLFYWHREAKNSNAEVDYLITKKNTIFPVEVKSGTKGSMQSMFLFLKEKNKNRGIRVSNENFAAYDNIDVYPIYAIDNILAT
ncbi:MAG: ATP-binding protein [Chlorobi bacterium]|nr:ATP-binding protein [Chlorobiota bacterium]